MNTGVREVEVVEVVEMERWRSKRWEEGVTVVEH